MAKVTTRPKVLALDMDGTLLEHEKYPRYGKPIPGWKEELEALRQAGWKIAIWTCRTKEEYDAIREHLTKHEIPFDYINENPHEGPSTSPKIYADVYVDDRCIKFNGDPNGMAAVILKNKRWFDRGAGDV